jgi:hypothetical protein
MFITEYKLMEKTFGEILGLPKKENTTFHQVKSELSTLQLWLDKFKMEVPRNRSLRQ